MIRPTLRVGRLYNEDAIKEVVTLLSLANSTNYNFLPTATYEPSLAFYVTQFQYKHGLLPDGIVGRNTWGKLVSYERKQPLNTTTSILDDNGELLEKYKLSHYSQEEMLDAWGRPGESSLVEVEFPYPMKLAWDKGTIVNHSRVHRKVKESLESSLKAVLDYYGIEEIERLGLDLFGGIYNYRTMRGGSDLSAHSWGVSIDVDTIGNPFRVRPRNTTMARPSNKAFCDIMVKHGFKTLEYDLQHWQHII